MAVQISMPDTLEGSDTPVVHLALSGKLERGDYDEFVPVLDEQIDRHRKINMMVELSDFHGWTSGAMWEDAKFGVHHFNDINNLAVLGDQQWEQWLASFAKAFTTANVRYFDVGEYQAASKWVREN